MLVMCSIDLLIDNVNAMAVQIRICKLGNCSLYQKHFFDDPRGSLIARGANWKMILVRRMVF